MQLTKQDKLYLSNSTGPNLGFSIGDEGVLLEILRNKLYSFPIRTLVQEYISNAMDANLSAGVGRYRLKLTSPFSGHPWFQVRDFGPGLTQEQMEDVFVRFGMSTKRDSASQIGGFGIGGKSAWAYADSFILESHCGGLSTSYLAYLGVTKTGVLTVTSRVPQAEPDGVLVKVPVRSGDEQEFERAIERMISFWPETPEINFDHSNPEALITLDNLRVYDSSCLPASFHKNVVFLLNDVPYVVETFRRELTLVVDLVDEEPLPISATRESLVSSREVNARVEKLAREAVQKAISHVKSGLDKHHSLPDLVEALGELGKLWNLVEPMRTQNFPGLVFDSVGVSVEKPLKLIYTRRLSDKHVKYSDLLMSKKLYSLSRMQAADYRDNPKVDTNTVIFGTASLKGRKLETLQPLIGALDLAPFAPDVLPRRNKTPKSNHLRKRDSHTVEIKVSLSDMRLVQLFRASGGSKSTLGGEPVLWFPFVPHGAADDYPGFARWIWDQLSQEAQHDISTIKSLLAYRILGRASHRLNASLLGRFGDPQLAKEMELILIGPTDSVFLESMDFVPVFEPATYRLAREKPLFFLGSSHRDYYLSGYYESDSLESWMNAEMKKIFGDLAPTLTKERPDEKEEDCKEDGQKEANCEEKDQG